jgi:hypothetical protein
MHSELYALLSETDKQNVDEYIEKNGYNDINKVKDIIKSNHVICNNYTFLDIDDIITIDLYINYPIFVTETEVYTKEELVDRYNFHLFEIEPEFVFDQQIIQVVNNDYRLYNDGDDKTELTLYYSKIYIGKEKWDDFMILLKFHRSLKYIETTKKLIEDKKKSNDIQIDNDRS